MDYPSNLSESDHHWYDLIQQCRTSGKSDRQWLSENNISSPTFYYHVKQLRKKACEIPANTLTRAPEIQEVVPLVITDDLTLQNHTISEPVMSSVGETALRLTIQNITVEITNQATQNVIGNTLAALQKLC